MRMNEIGYEGPPPIDGYGGGGFRIAGAFFEGDMMLLNASPTPWTRGAMDAAAFRAVIDAADRFDVLLVGMGVEIAALPAQARTALEEAGLGVEVMSTPSACRTYNVLLAEDRRVAVALAAV